MTVVILSQQPHRNKGRFSQKSFPLKTDFLAGRPANHLESSWHRDLGLAICKVSINLPQGQRECGFFLFALTDLFLSV